jgi:hypothetical protein
MLITRSFIRFRFDPVWVMGGDNFTGSIVFFHQKARNVGSLSFCDVKHH